VTEPYLISSNTQGAVLKRKKFKAHTKKQKFILLLYFTPQKILKKLTL